MNTSRTGTDTLTPRVVTSDPYEAHHRSVGPFCETPSMSEVPQDFPSVSTLVRCTDYSLSFNAMSLILHPRLRFGGESYVPNQTSERPLDTDLVLGQIVIGSPVV